MATQPLILVDADACPVKEEIYKVALRHAVAVEIIANSYMRVPDHPLISRHIVSADFDAADDFIAEKAGPMTIVITADILLAERALKKGADVIAPNGKPFTENSIGAAIATRAIMADLRGGSEQRVAFPSEMGTGSRKGNAAKLKPGAFLRFTQTRKGASGPPPFSKQDRSRFLSALDETLVRLKAVPTGATLTKRP